MISLWQDLIALVILSRPWICKGVVPHSQNYDEWSNRASSTVHCRNIHIYIYIEFRCAPWRFWSISKNQNLIAVVDVWTKGASLFFCSITHGTVIGKMNGGSKTLFTTISLDIHAPLESLYRRLERELNYPAQSIQLRRRIGFISSSSSTPSEIGLFPDEELWVHSWFTLCHYIVEW